MNGTLTSTSSTTTDYMYEFLATIQLEAFAVPLREKLQITRLSHFDYVKPKDLEKIGMSKPAIRRLLDAVARTKKLQIPARPAPPAPASKAVSTFSSSKPVTSSFVKVLNNQASNKEKSKQSLELTSSSSSSATSVSDVSQIISASAIEFVKTQSGEDVILGRGHFGVVKKAVWTRSPTSKLTVAVKCLNSSSPSDNADGNIGEIINEVTAMCQLNHPNLIKLYGVVFNVSITNKSNGPSSPSTDMMWMVTELASNGSLYSYLRKFKLDKKYPPLNQIYSYIYQIACGMEYLESKKLIHRDLAARNILLSSGDHVKICDFGMTRRASHNGQYKMTESHKIPCAWYAPESIRHKLFSSKSDVWAFGVTVWECFALGEQPWPRLSAGDILAKLETESKRLSQPYLCSRSFYRVIMSCWEFEPVDRPTFATLKVIIKGTRIVDMRAKDDFRDDGRLEVTKGDLITIVDGCASNYWWKGQNKRTFDVGKFPRAILDPERKLCGDDISLPLSNSFIHTGHMGANSKGRSWGNPGKIDDIFLRNPQKPHDFDNDADDVEEEETTVKNYKSQALSQQPNQDVLLIDFSDSSQTNDLKVSYPDSRSIESASLADLASLEIVPVPSISTVTTASQSSYYINNQYMNDRFVKSPSPPSIPPRSYYYNDLPTVTTSDYKPTTNPFHVNSHPQPYQSQKLKEFSHNSTSSLHLPLPQSQPQSSTMAPHPTFASNQTKSNNNLDDLLSKVMNDVLNDFDNLKY